MLLRHAMCPDIGYPCCKWDMNVNDNGGTGWNMRAESWLAIEFVYSLNDWDSNKMLAILLAKFFAV